MPDATSVTLHGRFSKADEKRYTHVPFEVPAGVRALHLRYDYSDRIPSDPLLSGGNTLDIGLFDPRGIETSSVGFRGWSGSNKQEFSVTETWATPPYLSGPLLAGTWHVLLGPYKVGPRGCEYQVHVSFGLDPGEAEVRPDLVHTTPSRLPAAAEAGWLRGDLHCHTLHSDGDSWPVEMLQRAVDRGLEFLGVTDHNQVGHQADYARVRGTALPVVLPGVEVTTYGGHWNAWGTDRWWEFRDPSAEAVSQSMLAAAASGALVSVNHPKPFGPAWEYGPVLGYQAVEVWNGEWARSNHASLAWWEEQVRGGRRLVALGGSDTHHLRTTDPDMRHARDLGVPTTWAHVGSDRTAEGVLAALRAGRVFISRGPEGPQVYLSRRAQSVASRSAETVALHVVGARGAAVLLIGPTGVLHAAHVGTDDWSDTIRLTDSTGYLRAQVVDQGGQVLALTNAI
jgi:hypothetical protein